MRCQDPLPSVHRCDGLARRHPAIRPDPATKATATDASFACAERLLAAGKKAGAYGTLISDVGGMAGTAYSSGAFSKKSTASTTTAKA